MKRLLLILAIVAAPSVAFAGDQGYLVPKGSAVCAASGTLCVASGDACTGTATYTMSLAKLYSKVRALVDYTHSTGTSLTVTGKCTLTSGGTYGSYASRSITAGASTLTAVSETWDPDATAALMPEWDVRGCYDFRLSVTINGCTGSTVAVTVTALAGQ